MSFFSTTTRPPIQPEFLEAVRYLLANETGRLVDVLQEKKFDFPRFQEFLKDHRLFNFAFPFLDREELKARCPSPFLQRLAAVRTNAMARQNKQLATLELIDEALKAGEIDFLLMKGFAVSTRFYSDTLHRHQSDLDILVHPEQVWETVRALRPLGIHQPPSAEPLSRRWIFWHHEIELAHGDVRIDLHWKTRKWPGIALKEKSYWKLRETFSVAGHNIPTLSTQHSLLLLLVSLALDIRRGAGRLKHFIDIYHHLAALDSQFDWSAFFRERRKERTEFLCGNILIMLSHLLGADDPSPSQLRLAELSQFVARLDPRMSMTREQTFELLESEPGHLKNLAWFHGLLPGAWLTHLKWHVQRACLFPDKIPGATLRKIQWIGKTGWNLLKPRSTLSFGR